MHNFFSGQAEALPAPGSRQDHVSLFFRRDAGRHQESAQHQEEMNEQTNN